MKPNYILTDSSNKTAFEHTPLTSSGKRFAASGSFTAGGFAPGSFTPGSFTPGSFTPGSEPETPDNPTITTVTDDRTLLYLSENNHQVGEESTHVYVKKRRVRFKETRTRIFTHDEGNPLDIFKEDQNWSDLRLLRNSSTDNEVENIWDQRFLTHTSSTDEVSMAASHCVSVEQAAAANDECQDPATNYLVYQHNNFSQYYEQTDTDYSINKDDFHQLQNSKILFGTDLEVNIVKYIQGVSIASEAGYFYQMCTNIFISNLNIL